ncbi:Uma2 family endonuclease [Dolichospermum sp. ST_sed1]|nr:Uma2 family endonuclease [Dolichospermum sp. ST_sed1]MDD1425309.1 Uma2 family endonuclease [Dolichospermum sp. ST_sed9]MDD1431541.1 Uma2 family endonuclease [Dolichospermum sp. ST_sed6]MDD1440994.1 Uma2 family endonuclease [Dolichospermum sp. ST_sed3]MDD1446045.1 Uma2 family endonuclease [Dolichospermum sp. ST_sed8]MDD1455042.1 Uma2 family endonuclease [Dolichospermum sp. ST_sed7]MDD1460933.1 Uma2 family endonuclease [Dolichospermum sp. ST_sed2]MDD1465236.1 Uma2 family endonuclease [Dolic
MTVTQNIEPGLDVIFPLSNLESDEPPLESSLHLQQMLLLIQCLNWWWRDINKINNYFAAGNMTIYYSPRQIKTKDFRGPDFFLVLDTEDRDRNNWVIWEEGGKYPNLIIELLSPSTASTDKGLKKQIYQDIFRTPEYFWFNPQNLEFAGFILFGGTYQPIEPNPQGLLWSQQLNLYLGVHDGKLRYFMPEGQLMLTPEEYGIQQTQLAEEANQRAKQQFQLTEEANQRAEQQAQFAEEANQRAEQQSQRAEQQAQLAEQQAQLVEQQAKFAEEVTQRAERLAAKLRELNIDPDIL